MKPSTSNPNQESNLQYVIRFPMLALGIMALLTGIWSGLLRMGWSFPTFETNWIPLHGPLMVCGFLGTVIGMERAVAQQKMFFYLAPLFTALGGILMIFEISQSYSAILFSAGSLVLVINFVFVLKNFPSMHVTIMALGSLLFFIGNIIWFSGFPIPNVVLWWAGFLILTIAGERLELNRLLQPTTSIKLFFHFAVSIFLIGVILSTFIYSMGMFISGIGMIFLSYWLLRYDLAKKSIKNKGLPKFIAIALITGYVWLGISGVFALLFNEMQVGPYYDTILHCIFLGFVFSMIFGHAPIIFPAILKVNMNFKNRFYIHLLLLHFSLIIRILSDITFWIDGRLLGSLLNGIAVLLFLANTVSSIQKKSSV